MELNIINLVCSSDDNYATYIPTLMESIYTSSNKSDFYKIFILDSGIKKETKYIIKNSIKKYTCLSINFIDVNFLINKYKEIFVTFAHFTPATYIRFFISELLPDLNKIIYLDIDLLVKSDLSELYHIDISGHVLAAAIDACYARELYNDKNDLKKYTEKVLGLPKDVPEFNAGVLVINLELWRELNLTQACLNTLKKIGIPRVLDQCVLNSVIEQKYIYTLPVEWNYVWHAELNDLEANTRSTLFNQIITDYKNKINSIKIVHYTSPIKPWNMYSKTSEELKTIISFLGDEWWYTTLKTKFFMKILNKQLKLLNNNYPVNEQLELSNNNYPVKIRFYLFGIRFFKKIEENRIKKYYIFNILILKIKY